MSEFPVKIIPTGLLGQRSSDTEFGFAQGRSRGFGPSKMTGYVTSAMTESGLRRWVHLFMEQYWRAPGNKERAPLWHINSVRSDINTGYFEFPELDPNLYYTIISFDNTGSYDPILKGGLVPDGGTPVQLDFKPPEIGEFSDDDPGIPVFPVFNLIAFIGEGIPGFGEGVLKLNLTNAGETPRSKLVYLFLEDPNWRRPPKTEWSPLRLVATVRTNAITGSCEFRHLSFGNTYSVQAFDPEGEYDPIFLSGLTPDPM